MNEMVLQDDPQIHLFVSNYLSLHTGKKPTHCSIIQLEASRFSTFHICHSSSPSPKCHSLHQLPPIFFFNSKHRIAKRERIMTKRDWGCVSPKFLTIFCVSMLLHHHNSPWMDLREVTPNLAHRVTPNRPIILSSIQPIIFQVCQSAKVNKFDQESRTLYYISSIFLENICYNRNSRLKICIVW